VAWPPLLRGRRLPQALSCDRLPSARSQPAPQASPAYTHTHHMPHNARPTTHAYSQPSGPRPALQRRLLLLLLLLPYRRNLGDVLRPFLCVAHPRSRSLSSCCCCYCCCTWGDSSRYTTSDCSSVPTVAVGVLVSHALWWTAGTTLGGRLSFGCLSIAFLLPLRLLELSRPVMLANDKRTQQQQQRCENRTNGMRQ
jgi:hypothetical protein